MKNYFLVSRNIETEQTIQLPIKKCWYYQNTDNTFQYSNDIAAIDLVTIKFNSKEQLINRLYDKKYIDNKNIDLFITHTKNFKGKKYITEYELIYNSKRTPELLQLARNRINNEHLNAKIVDDIMNKFITKCYYNKSFYEFMTYPYSYVDDYIIEKIIANHKKIDYSIKYLFKDKMNNYLTMRNIILMWNIYDTIAEMYPEISSNEAGKIYINEFIKRLDINNNRKKSYPELIIKCNNNYVQGQMNINEYIQLVEKKSYKEQLDLLKEDELRIKEEIFDSLELQALEKKYGRDDVCNHLNCSILMNLSPADKFRLGIINYITYLNEVRKNKIKKGN